MGNTQSQISAQRLHGGAPPDGITILAGYEGDDAANPTYRVIWTRVTFVEVYRGVVQPLPDARKPFIDRIRIFDVNAKPVAPLWAPPVFPRSLKRLAVQNGGLPTATIGCEGKFRCWLPNSESKSTQSFAFTIGFDLVSGVVSFQKLKFDDLKPDTEAPYKLADLGKRTFTGTGGGFGGVGFGLPPLVMAMGLAETHADSNEHFRRILTFVPNIAADGETPLSRRMKLSMEVLLSPEDLPELRPFGVSFQEKEMPPVHIGSGSHISVVTQRQPYGEDEDKPFGSHWIVEAQCPQLTALARWNNLVVDPVSSALLTVQQGSPVTTLPSFDSQEPPAGTVPTWIARYSILDRAFKENPDAARIPVVLPGLGPANVDAILVARLLTPDAASAGTTVVASMPGLVTETSAPLQARFRLTMQSEDVPETDPTVVAPHNEPAISFSIQQAQPANPAAGPAQTVRMGALDLQFPATVETIPNFPGRDALGTALAVLDLDGKTLDVVTSLNVTYTLALVGLQPGGQDDVPGTKFITDLGDTIQSEDDYRAAFERRPPLVILTGAPPAGDSPFFLTANEQIARRKNQSITLTLRSTSSAQAVAGGDRNVIVIDPEPFLLAKVRVPDFDASLASAVTNEVGHWTNRADITGWELNTGASGFDLLLPPQGVGETMHRNRDANDLTPDSASADFRFTPATVCNLQASFFKQRFVDTPWNLRRILGFPGQREPGAAVNSIQFEMLYGMSGQVTYPFLRLAEIGARLGLYAGQQPPNLPWISSHDQTDGYLRFRSLWLNLYQALKTRIAVLEPYDADRPGPLLLRDSDGLSYSLRSTAHLRYPIVGDTPVNPNIPADPKDGLAGSFAWAFESKNIYEAVWRKPTSDTAQLANPFFSALGGTIHQKATFDNRRSAIYSDVVFGRASNITVERIGRISVTWNRAKHVIVYERSVAASRQFYLEQYPFTGNPILRKVDEYVEILQEERAFPDNNAARLTRGPVQSCRFSGGKPPRIRVNSRWGEDVGTTGWKIPLWVRSAAPSDVYPKPVVHFICVGQAEDQSPAAPIDDPEKLYFYTNTDPNLTDDTDSWPAVSGVDFDPLMANALNPPQPRPGDLDTFAQPAPFVAPGSAAFTFSLAPAAKPINVVAERAEQPIAAALRNITLMRGVATAKAAAVGDYGKLTALRDTLFGSVAAELSRMPAQGVLTETVANIAGRIRDDVGKLSAGAHDLAVSLQSEADSLGRTLGSHLSFLEPDIRAQAGSLMASLLSDFGEALDALQAVESDFTKAAPNILPLFDGLLAGGDTDFSGYTNLFRSLPGSINSVLNQMDAAVERAQGAVAALRDSFFSTDCEICKHGWDPGQPPSPEADSILAHNYDSTVERLRELEFLIAEVPRQWLGNRLDTARLALRESMDDLTAAARDLRFQARSSISQKDVADRLSKLNGLLDNLETAALDQMDAIEQQLTSIDAAHAVGGLDGVLGTLHKAIASAIQAPDWPTFRKNLADAVGLFLNGLADAITAELQNFRARLLNAASDLFKALFPDAGKLAAAVQQFLDPKRLDALANILDGAKVDFSHVRKEMERLYGRMSQDLAELLNRAAFTIKPPAIPNPIDANTIRLLRALGDPPKVPHLEFPIKLPDCSFHFFDPTLLDLPSVKISPLLAEGNKFAHDVLNGVDIRLPTAELLDRFKPFQLQQFDWSRLFPNFAGLKLDSLFAGLRPPSLANDNVKVTHGEDLQSRSGWIEMDVNVPITQPCDVFNLAGVTLRLLSATFVASVRIEASGGQPPRQTTSGSITGDWELTIGGTSIAVLTRCSLQFDNGGKIRFDVSPERVRLQQVLAFLADLMSKFGYNSQGFSFAITPTGVRTVLDLPLPDVQAGAFGIANLRLGFLFAIDILPDFQIATQLSVGRKTAPFALTIFILGGAGYLETGVRYKPPSDFTTDVSIGIMASASLAIALGPIKGGIYAFFGITVEHHSGGGRDSRLTIGLILLFVGEVSLLGIISVGLRMGLEAQYTVGGGLKGRGFVSFSIKICWCFTLNVSAAVEYTFGASASRGDGTRELLARDLPTVRAAVVGDYDTPAAAYIDMFA